MLDWLQARVQASPDKMAIITETNQYTFRQLNALVDEYVPLLSHGQRTGLLLSNRVEYAALLLAALRTGVEIVPLNGRLTWDEIKWQLQNTDCNYLLVSDDLLDLLPFEARGEGVVRQVLLPKVDKDFKLRPRRMNEDKAPRTMADVFAIVHTSGTSGKPKGAMLTYGNLYQSAMASAYRIGHLPDDRWLCVLPLFHVGGMSIIIRATLYGITVDLRQRFDVASINHALSHEPITLVSLVPTMLYRLLDQRTEAWSPGLRLVLLGGAATTPELMQRCLEENIPVATTYGMTEASSQIATTLPGDAARKPGTVGKPLLFTEVRIVDENDEDVAPGQYGEIIVRGPTVMRGYYKNPAATEKTLRGGWLHSGDIGYLDPEGDLWLVQRRSDLIVTGGENVYPAEVEAVLRSHPAIKEAAVVGIHDAEWGQRVAAAIVCEANANLTAQEVEAHARQHLAGYKIPRIILFVEDLPLTSSGKIQRNAVRDLLETEMR